MKVDVDMALPKRKEKSWDECTNPYQIPIQVAKSFNFNKKELL